MGIVAAVRLRVEGNRSTSGLRVLAAYTIIKTIRGGLVVFRLRMSESGNMDMSFGIRDGVNDASERMCCARGDARNRQR